MLRRPQSKPSASKRATSALPHEVRIIGGKFKRTKLPVSDKPGLRPTPDRVRETLFNWLGQDLTGWRCLDAFAGSGALGFEAASRGASEVLMVERDAALVAQMQRMQTQLRVDAVRVVRGDGLAVIGQIPGQSLDLVLLDPPFNSDLFEATLVASAKLLVATGWIYLEAPSRWSDASLQQLGLAVHRYLKAGAVHAHLLKRVDAVAAPDDDSPVNATKYVP